MAAAAHDCYGGGPRTDLGNGHLLGALPGERPDPADEAHVSKRVAEFVRMVHDHSRVVAEGARHIPVQGTQLHRVAGGGGGRAPRAVHGAVALGQLAWRRVGPT